MFSPTCGTVGVFTGFLMALLEVLLIIILQVDDGTAGGGGGCDMKAFCKVA